MENAKATPLKRGKARNENICKTIKPQETKPISKLSSKEARTKQPGESKWPFGERRAPDSCSLPKDLSALRMPIMAWGGWIIDWTPQNMSPSVQTCHTMYKIGF